MKRFLSLVLLLTVLVIPTAHAVEGAFGRWWIQFQSAVAKDDKEGLAAMARFPLEWENLALRSIKSKEEFVQRFSEIFTADVKEEIARGKPQKEAGGYGLNWKGRGKRAANSYSMVIELKPADVFVLNGLYEGPRD